ncbi:Hypothetical protein CINCED_3A010149 [Cinara cedri]|uniref:ATP-dependent DNA helicase n=1 Tax=Cinara cedri TaxID=506608 RepID=A0A5E4MLQ6_9HEMI|nr:Hypothetical protein CINCED_3A010149 [Cinara cedri]
MNCYKQFSKTDDYCNAYVTCASTGKAAVAINGVTVHTLLKILLSKFVPLSNEVFQQFQTLFKYVKDNALICKFNPNTLAPSADKYSTTPHPEERGSSQHYNFMPKLQRITTVPNAKG